MVLFVLIIDFSFWWAGSVWRRIWGRFKSGNYHHSLDPEDSADFWLKANSSSDCMSDCLCTHCGAGLSYAGSGWNVRLISSSVTNFLLCISAKKIVPPLHIYFPLSSFMYVLIGLSTELSWILYWNNANCQKQAMLSWKMQLSKVFSVTWCPPWGSLDPHPLWGLFDGWGFLINVLSSWCKDLNLWIFFMFN